MNINSISNANFCAKLSPELQSKMVVLGKYFKRTEQTYDYEELKHPQYSDKITQQIIDDLL